ncbi:Creatininase [Methanothermus fervidus DSM 2088]|uniref:2-amino-5-formylamino-6-ribosylaminopyrimidin-4(3H)-one 5'-monophosphate deformylase n=1 Tax=Methanothermus fervidus (strain ATCC 43054 / DSM 2088 / JCM 10308 / V24 S) TaxID=523846 RepID=ARFB_METFV|nr:2-amino-5-formylamino-6-ribosylaminopyrimidin-4(3H)-one 5'-monophosphate deformylase [Methanothermus fervidus]E3GWT5.1 RecName: Full=2-amino-5-formylamino-6-ribosylaminopyrimidin-4(3H)-one 5'-monophosphate deformylase; Short=FAPy deformylase; AltName: Full=Formamide hydrolase [Methanothermus fervidus DSM 2088]ADP78004.1 Creatininase [Methanothermus fervidus DSM 2088]
MESRFIKAERDTKLKLNYDAGNIISPKVHSVGVLALGSYLENHGPVLPIDTDIKIASYLALNASIKTGAKFIGTVYPATEYPYVKHGIHVSVKDLIENIVSIMKLANKYIGIDKSVIVNAHGGNLPLKKHINVIERETGMKIVMNNKIVEIEGPHAGSGETSLGYVIGIADVERMNEIDFKKYPEIGMVGLKSARKLNKKIDEGAKIVEKEGVKINPKLGRKLLNIALNDIINDIKHLIRMDKNETK